MRSLIKKRQTLLLMPFWKYLTSDFFSKFIYIHLFRQCIKIEHPYLITNPFHDVFHGK